jgi:hypothetical protein
MAGGSGDRISAVATAVPSPIQIRSWPLRDEGVGPWLFVAVIVGLAVAAAFVARNAGMGAILFAAMAVAAWRLWMPVRFELGSRGIVQTVAGRQQRIPWSSVARFEVRPHGVLFLTDADPRLLALLRGLYVPCRRERKDVVELVEFFLKARISGGNSSVRSRGR